MADLLSHRESTKSTFRFRMSNSWIVPAFYLSLAAFFIVLASYGGLLLLNRAQGVARDELTAQIKEKEDELRSPALNQIFTLDAQLKNVRNVLSRHTFATNALAFVESITHPEVQFLNFSFAEESRKIDMTALGTSYSTVSEQIRLFELSPLVERVEFGGLSLGEDGLVSFSLSLFFSSALLQLQQ